MAQVTVKSGSRPYTREIRADGHRWMADEAQSLGGQGRGPSPYRLLLSALGACMAITVQMYARRKGWPLQSPGLELEHERVHAEDCRDCESREGKISEIRVRIQLEGDLTQEQRQRIFEIAGKCPVHRTLSGEIKIRHRLED